MRGRKQCDPVSGCGKFYKQHLNECPSCGASEAFSNLIPFNPLDWTYDLECYPNIFTADFKHMNSGATAFYEISDRRNDLDGLLVFLFALKQANSRMIGYNNIGYDYPMLHFILENAHLSPNQTDLYNKSMSIINTPWERRWDNVIWDNDIHIVQIDLYKIHHFDNEARRTSLKMLEFNMRLDNISDLPYPPGTVLNDLEKNVLIEYNHDDVDATEKFAIESIEMIEFREQLSEKYGQNFLNHSDKKIGTDIFVNKLEAFAPGTCYARDHNNKKVKRQTPRSSINLGEIIFPYIEFKVREFELVKQWLSSKVITQTKGVFEFITVSAEMAFIMRHDLVKVHGLSPEDVPSKFDIKNIKTLLNKGIPLDQCFDDIKNRTDLYNFKFVSGVKDKSGLNCIVDGFRYDFGTGGIHGSIDSAIVCSDDDGELWDWDVGGYYPTLGSVNKLFPEHLSEQFGIVDKELAIERKQYDKGTALNNSIKLARNGAYGDSNNKYSVFFDPQYTMSITINGQLLLCMLAQHLIDIPGLKMIQINTDGLTVKCPRQHIDTMKKICKWWENYTCLELESVIYKRMFIRDVNNYIGEYKDGKLKSKGAYVHKSKESQGPKWTPSDMDWHQNHSSLVIPKAAEAALVHGKDIREFITNHDDIFDFMLRTKVGRSDNLIISDAAGNERELQKITRYYISVDGGTLTKISPPTKGHQVGQWKRSNSLSDQFYKSVIAELKNTTAEQIELDSTGVPWDERINTKNRSKYEIRRTGVNAGQLVAPCNDIKDADRNNINFEYYIAEAEKLVNPLRN